MQLNMPQQPVPHSVQLGLLPVFPLFHLAVLLKGQYRHFNVIKNYRMGRLEAGQQKEQIEQSTFGQSSEEM